MSKFLTSSNWNNPKFNKIIDVRSPYEFKNDHLVGSINCPVLSDTEREIIGIIYKKDSPFKAKVIGSTLISKNISKIIKKYFYDKPGSWRPLIYCWRGGLRSRSLCLVMNEIGWRTTLLRGGYKFYRNEKKKRIHTITK